MIRERQKIKKEDVQNGLTSNYLLYGIRIHINHWYNHTSLDCQPWPFIAIPVNMATAAESPLRSSFWGYLCETESAWGTRHRLALKHLDHPQWAEGEITGAVVL